MYSANIKKLREETPDPLDINTIIIWYTISSVSGYSLAWDNNDNLEKWTKASTCSPPTDGMFQNDNLIIT